MIQKFIAIDTEYFEYFAATLNILSFKAVEILRKQKAEVQYLKLKNSREERQIPRGMCLRLGTVEPCVRNSQTLASPPFLPLLSVILVVVILSYLIFF